jgi:hypothetical protein
MSESSPILRLPPDWHTEKDLLERAGLDGWRLIAFRVGVEYGHYSDQCEYRPDPTVWSYYRRLPPAHSDETP